MAEKSMKEMTFLDHLEALRWMLIRSTVAILICAVVAYFFIDFIFSDIIFAATRPDFITYEFFCETTKYLGLDDESTCVKDFSFIIQNTNVGGQFSIFIWTCIAAGFILGFPYILFEIWKFIKPALYEKERKMAIAFVLVTSILFFLGVLFGFYLVVPLSVNFFATFVVSDTIVNQFNVDSYISMVKTSLIASGLVFELPVIIYFLAKLGLVTAEFLRKYRRFAIVIILIIAAIVTPPDVTSQLLVSIPILVLYECSIFIAKVVVNNRLKNEQSSNRI